MDVNLVIGIVITLVFSAFFAGMEIAFVSSNRLLLEMDKERGGLSRKVISVFYAHPNAFVSTMLVGNNIVLVVYGILFAALIDGTLFVGMDHAFTLPADTIISTLIVLFTGEFLPKSLFKSNPNRLLTIFSIPAYICYIVLWPISRLTTFFARIILRMLGVRMEGEEEEEGFSKVDLDFLVQSSIEQAKSDEEIEDEVKIFQNALDFPDIKVRDCMVPRTEIRAVATDCELDDLMQMFMESGLSKIVVYEEDIDHVVGYIHSSEMFRSPKNWREHVSKMPFVPETMPASKLMRTFMQQKKSLAIVIDEFGGTSGIVSLEDIVEEIFGDIEDEHDSSKYVAEKVSDEEYVLSARLEIDKVNEKFDLGLPVSEDYKTIGGLILHEYQSFPKLNEVITIGKREFKILKNTKTKIELVRLKIVE